MAISWFVRDGVNYYDDLGGVRGRILDDLALPDRVRRVLDIGSGDGWFALELACRAPQGFVLGVDRARCEVEGARAHARRSRVRNAAFLRMDAYHLAFPAQTFQVAGSFLALQDICHTEQDLARLFAELSRVLRPGGAFVVCTVTPEDTETESQRLGLQVYEAFGGSFFSKSQLKNALHRAGLRVDQVKFYYTGVKLDLEGACQLIRSECAFLHRAYGLEEPDWEPIWEHFRPLVARCGGLEVDAKVTAFFGHKLGQKSIVAENSATKLL